MATSTERFYAYFLFGEPIYGEDEFREAFNSLLEHAGQLNQLFKEAYFIEAFDTVYSERLHKFITRCGTVADGDGRSKVLDSLLHRLILPLYLLHQYDSMFDLLIHILEYPSVHSSPALAAAMTGNPTLFYNIVTAKDSDNFRMALIQNIRAIEPVPVDTIKDWTDQLSTLVSGCKHHPGIAKRLEMWKRLRTTAEELRDSLKRVQWGNKVPVYSAETHRALEDFNLPDALSLSSAQRALAEIETKFTSQILAAIALTLPCDFCFEYGDLFEGGNDRSMEQRYLPLITATDDIEESDLRDMFKSDLGVWSISLSGSALGDLKASKKEGMLCTKISLVDI